MPSAQEWIAKTLKEHGESRLMPTATHALAALLAEREVRPLAHRHGILGMLAPLLRQRSGLSQTLYEAALCCWRAPSSPRTRLRQAVRWLAAPRPTRPRADTLHMTYTLAG